MDQETFAVRVEAIKARLYRTAYLYLGSESAALDAVDEAVYQALRALKKLRKPEFFETWITRILINECHRELRRRKRFSDEVLPETAGPGSRRSMTPWATGSAVPVLPVFPGWSWAFPSFLTKSALLYIYRIFLNLPLDFLKKGRSLQNPPLLLRQNTKSMGDLFGFSDTHPIIPGSRRSDVPDHRAPPWHW